MTYLSILPRISLPILDAADRVAELMALPVASFRISPVDVFFRLLDEPVTDLAT